MPQILTSHQDHPIAIVKEDDLTAKKDLKIFLTLTNHSLVYQGL